MPQIGIRDAMACQVRKRHSETKQKSHGACCPACGVLAIRFPVSSCHAETDVSTTSDVLEDFPRIAWNLRVNAIALTFIRRSYLWARLGAKTQRQQAPLDLCSFLSLYNDDSFKTLPLKPRETVLNKHGAAAPLGRTLRGRKLKRKKERKREREGENGFASAARNKVSPGLIRSEKNPRGFPLLSSDGMLRARARACNFYFSPSSASGPSLDSDARPFI